MSDATPTPKKRTSTRPFGSTRKLPSGRIQARYYDASGVRHTAPMTFPSKTDAKAWLAAQQTDLNRGEWLNPTQNGAGITFAAWSKDWLDTRSDITRKTRSGYEALLRNHVLPFFGHYRLKEVNRSTVLRFVRVMEDKGAKPGTIRNAFAVLSAVFRHAVEDGRLAKNPTRDVKLPAIPKEEDVVPLTPEQVEALAQAVAVRPAYRKRPAEYHPEWSLLVRFAAYSGLRAGEIAGLRSGRVDLLRSTVRVTETVVSLHGELLEGQPPKTKQKRTVNIPRSLSEDLAVHLGDRATDPKALVFPDPDGGPWDEVYWYSNIFKPALRRAGLPASVRFHDLRHTYASLLIQQGEPLFAVSRQLGHSTTNVTESTYGHLFPSTLDAMSARLDATYRRAGSTPVEGAQVHQIGRPHAG